MVGGFDLSSRDSMSVATYMDANGDVACVTTEGGVLKIPAEFSNTLEMLDRNLRLALDCMDVFGGVPIPVAKAILRDIEPAHTALDLAIKNGKAGD